MATPSNSVTTVNRVTDLETSVRFGHGLFQLVVYLAPPHHATILRAVGFPINPAAGLANLARVAEGDNGDVPGLRGRLAAVVVGWVNVLVEGGGGGAARGWDDWTSCTLSRNHAGWRERIQGAEQLVERCAGGGALPLFVRFHLQRLLGRIDDAITTLDASLTLCPAAGSVNSPDVLLLEKASLLALS